MDKWSLYFKLIWDSSDLILFNLRMKSMPAQLKPGLKIKNYVITKNVLNVGMFVNTYMAKKNTGETVFFKQFTSPSIVVPWFNKYMEHEEKVNKLLNKIKPDGCVSRILEHFVDDFVYYQVIEPITGKSLQSKIIEAEGNHDNFPEISRYNLCIDFMEIIKKIHELKIVHCNLKPDNIFTDEILGTENFKVKIIDFDFSFVEDEAPPWREDYAIIGTPGYFSPEHWHGKLPSTKSDVFICGIILYQLICEEYPFEEFKVDALKRKFLKPIEVKPDLEKKVSDIIYACLDPEEDGRPTSEEVHQVLSGLKGNFNTPGE